jgi:hypothetical protein
MLALYLENGREAVEEVLRWIPASRWYCNPEAELDTIADLRRKWKYVSAECDRYYAKAVESGTEDRCEDWIEQKFNAAGGDNAEFICYERLHPINSADAAAEASMDAFDDEFGVDVFNPWAEQDLEDAVLAADSQVSRDGIFNPWSDEEDGNPAGDNATPHANESDRADDAEAPEAPVYRYCEDCCSVHAGGCMPDDDVDVE